MSRFWWDGTGWSMWARRMGRTVAIALAVWLGVYAIVPYTALPFERVAPDLASSFRAHATAVYLHVFGASLAPVLGLVQLAPGIRTRWPRMHRWMGRFYLGVCVLVGGASGFWLALSSPGGTSVRVGFATLAVAWVGTGAVALARVCDGDLAGHREWMVRNYALTWGAVMLRVYMGVSQEVLGLTFVQAYPVVAWLCWVPNLALAEWYVSRRRSRANALR